MESVLRASDVVSDLVLQEGEAQRLQDGALGFLEHEGFDQDGAFLMPNADGAEHKSFQ